MISAHTENGAFVWPHLRPVKSFLSFFHQAETFRPCAHVISELRATKGRKDRRDGLSIPPRGLAGRAGAELKGKRWLWGYGNASLKDVLSQFPRGGHGCPCLPAPHPAASRSRCGTRSSHVPISNFFTSLQGTTKQVALSIPSAEQVFPLGSNTPCPRKGIRAEKGTQQCRGHRPRFSQQRGAGVAGAGGALRFSGLKPSTGEGGEASLTCAGCDCALASVLGVHLAS